MVQGGLAKKGVWHPLAWGCVALGLTDSYWGGPWGRVAWLKMLKVLVTKVYICMFVLYFVMLLS